MTDRTTVTGGGRARGLRGVARAWLEVIVRPRRFFATGVTAGDQGPGLLFLMGVVALEEASRLAMTPEAVPELVGGRLVSAALMVGLATLLVTPLALHVLGAIQTALLGVLVTDRAGVSETVQVLAYAAAPCVLAGVPDPWVRVACGLYGSALLIVGLATVHRTTYWRAGVAGAVPALIGFGYGFRGVAAFDELVDLLTAATHLI